MNDIGHFSMDKLLGHVAGQTSQKTFGWRGLDGLEIGMNPGELCIVAGRTGHGKSTVVLNVLAHWLETFPDEVYVLFSFEIPAEAVAMKLASAVCRKIGGVGWSYHDVRRWVQRQHGRFSSDLNDAKLNEAINLIKKWQDRLIVVYEPDWNVEKVVTYTRELNSQIKNIGGIFIDYLQLVAPPPGRYENREHEVSTVARQLKRLGVRVGCPTVAAAQIGKEAAMISDWIPNGTLEDERVLRAIAKRRPQLHHLREGGGEQEADLVIGLLNYRADFVMAAEEAGIDHKTLLEVGGAGPFDLGVMKNRYGQLGVASLILESRSGFIRDAGVFGK
jgi:replicative DNA helicase